MVAALAIITWSANVRGAESDATAARIEAEELGRAMFSAETTSASVDENIITDARKRIADWCPFEYKPIVVSYRSGQLVAFIAQPQGSQGLVFGRHFLVRGAAVEASTKSCFAIPKLEPGKTAAGAYTTHLLSKSPTAFHVYLSLKYGQPIFVGIDRTVWKVDNGKITWAGRT